MTFGEPKQDDHKPVRTLVTRQTDPQLWCRADGCPLRWSVQNSEVTACSYHAWEPTNRWPAITDALLRDGPWSLRTKPGGTHTTRDMLTRVKDKLKAPK